MAKLVIPKESIPDFNVYTGSIGFRFRIITDDKNVSSYWSPVYSINPTDPEQSSPDVGPTSFSGSGSILIDNKVDYASIVWNPVSVSNSSGTFSTLEYYDVWIKLSPVYASAGYWKYHGRVRSTSTNVIIPYSLTGYQWMSVEIYRPAKPALRISKSEIYQSSDHINISTDVISFPYVHDFSTGDQVIYTSVLPVGGLTNNSVYYIRKVSYYTDITLHPTKNDAINNTNKINITSNTNALGFFGKPECPACDFLIYSTYNYNLL